MIRAGGSFATRQERLTGRRVVRAIAAKASDLLPLCDFASLLIAGYLSLFAHAAFFASTPAPLEAWDALYRLVWVAAAIAPFILYEQCFAAYAGAGNNTALVRGFVRRFLLFFGVIFAIAFAGRWLDHAPQAWLALWLGVALLLTVTSRWLLARYLQRLTQQGVLTEAVAVVGAGREADRLIPLLRGSAVLFGVFDDAGAKNDRFIHQPESTVDGLIARARGAGPDRRPDRILIALPAGAEHQLPSIVERLRPLGIPVELCQQSLSLALPAQVIGYVGAHAGHWLPVTLLADRPIKRWNAVLKTAKDFALGSAITLMLLPLLACIALAIRLDSPGPILFKQRRHGFNNREFDIYKFRTMLGAAEAPGTALQQTIRGDHRVTRVGRFLRKWSLDELPQVFNVLKGSMSLVGPRPHAVAMRTEDQSGHQIVAVYPHRHRVKPGITGWAQINGSRGATNTVEQLRRRIELDLYYVENWSLLLDLKILFSTFKVVLRAADAY